MECSFRGKSASAPWVILKDHNLEEIMGDNKERESVAENPAPSYDNITTTTPSVRTTRLIESYFWAEKKARGTQRQSILTNVFPHNNIKYKKKVV